MPAPGHVSIPPELTIPRPMEASSLGKGQYGHSEAVSRPTAQKIGPSTEGNNQGGPSPSKCGSQTRQNRAENDYQNGSDSVGNDQTGISIRTHKGHDNGQC